MVFKDAGLALFAEHVNHRQILQVLRSIFMFTQKIACTTNSLRRNDDTIGTPGLDFFQGVRF